ncbi:unnamed protein product [marine sediment metagenome]|uniref:Uncharacterized protein n=1 Tax=marine sediment metagenome TaxID=412755 RepID=X1DHV4_9ZZZZ
MDLEDLVIKIYKGKHSEDRKKVWFMKWEGTINGELHGKSIMLSFSKTPYEIIHMAGLLVDHLYKYYRTSKGV